MRNRSRRSILPVLLVAVLLLQSLTLRAVAAPDGAPRVAPGNQHFQRTWERTDQPVLSGATARTWMWGPEANTEVISEPYAEAPGGIRQVQYYDKSRMEITDPAADPTTVWYVTNGLLVVELMSGQMQVGHNAFETRSAAVVNVAGDADDPNGPTYATFGSLRTAPALPDFATIIQRVDRQGNVTEDPSLASQNVTVAQHVQVPNIDHQVAGPFWTFMTSSGPVLENGQLITAPLFIDPYYATGYPVTEAYWADVLVAGTLRLVLIQCFERRCLTYTPGNPAGFETEAGNVGQHYRTWRETPVATADSLIINELSFWPEAGEHEWVEIYNPTSAPATLSSWSLTNDAKSNTIGLPGWTLPAGGYLVVHFADGTNDEDFSDGAGHWYTGSAPGAFFTINTDGAGLYWPEGIVDYLAWSGEHVYGGGAAQADAVAADIWTAGRYVDIVPQAGTNLIHALEPGETLGRDAAGSDTDDAYDWDLGGGPDAYGQTPGAVNEMPSPFEDETEPLPGARDTLAPRVEPQRKWTVMVYMDLRDIGDLGAFGNPARRGGLFRGFLYDIKQMELAGSNADINIVLQMTTYGPNRALLANRFFIQKDPDAKDQLITRPMRIPAGDAVDPGDPAALSAFITWAKANYPAERYAMVLGGHGRGWKGMMFAPAANSKPGAVIPADFLTMSELSTGLSAIGGLLGGEKFETVIFESCLMGQAEVGYQIEPYAKYMVASEEVTFTGFGWKGIFTDLQNNPNWGGAEFADRTAQQNAGHNIMKMAIMPQVSIWTIASVDLAGLAQTLMPAVDEFGDSLRLDISDYKAHDNPADNSQIVIKHQALEKAESFFDTNFLDLYHLGQLVAGLPLLAASDGQAVVNALNPGGPVIRWEAHGPVHHPNAHGLSIYFPNDQLYNDLTVWSDGTLHSPGALGNDGRDACLSTTCRERKAFDNPLYDPATTQTHLYKRDPSALIPRVALANHAMRDDPGFAWPNQTRWDEFLHRFYKPVADACIRDGNACVQLASGPVGSTFTLSGAGSSDSDGPEGSPNNDVPAHTEGDPSHYYWDFDALNDNPAQKPDYAEGTLYENCEEDCDRDDSDDADDDVDAAGITTVYTCATAGTFTIVLNVWDEHHDQVRMNVEDRAHNQGRHWLHFNVHQDSVTISCSAIPTENRKEASPNEVERGEDITYEITMTMPSDAEPGAADNGEAYIHDPLPSTVEYNGDVECSLPGCGYNAEQRLVYWEGPTQPGMTVVLEFSVHVPEDVPPGITEIVNEAFIDDGLNEDTLITETELTPDEPPPPPPPPGDSEKVATGSINDADDRIEYAVTIVGNPELDGPEDAGMIDELSPLLVFDLAAGGSCSFGLCNYNPDTHVVTWEGQLDAGQEVTIEWSAYLDPDLEEYPDEVENCAQIGDGLVGGEVCDTTNINIDGPPPPPGESEKVATTSINDSDDPILYTVTLVGDPNLNSPAVARMQDNLPDYLEIDLSEPIECSAGICGWDVPVHAVYWDLMLDAGQTETITFTARLADDADPPGVIENCAMINDGIGQSEVCDTTSVNITGVGVMMSVE